MLDEINIALDDYYDKWQGLVEGRTDKAFFQALKPVAVGWKVADRAEYDRLVRELHDQCGRLLETWMNGRWIAKLVLNDTELKGGVCIIKVMQRRPGSTDSLGLDHVDFYTPDAARLDRVMEAEPDLKATQESNDAIDDYSWVSVWFDGTEAKIKPYTVLGTVADELHQIEERLVGPFQGKA